MRYGVLGPVEARLDDVSSLSAALSSAGYWP